MGTTSPLTVIFDADSVIFDWEPAFVEEFRHDFPDLRCAGVGERSVFDLNHGLNGAEKLATRAIMDKPGFYARLPLIDGAAEALSATVAAGVDVVICTSPWVTNPTCASDKLDSIEKLIGTGWARRTIIASDKTRVRGDLLIDDKPDVLGHFEPTWEHIYFTQSWNAGRTDHRRIDSWAEWPAMLSAELANREFRAA